MTNCRKCSQPAQLFLCPKCVDALREHATQLAWLIELLDETVTRHLQATRTRRVRAVVLFRDQHRSIRRVRRVRANGVLMCGLSGWHDVGRIVDDINPALPDLDPRIKLASWLHQRVKFTLDEIYPDHLASLFYRNVDLASFEWSDEMRKLPGQFDDRPHFGDSRARRIIEEWLAGQ